MVLLPVLVFFLLVGLAPGSWRQRFLLASLCWAVLVLAITEALSAWHSLNRPGLAMVWAAIGAALTVGAVMCKPALPRLPQMDRSVAAVTALILGGLSVTAVIAYCAAPSTWDSLTTHLVRVAFWQQNASVAMFPTYLLKRLDYPPWSQYAMAQFYILAGSDRWVSFVQWFGFAGGMVGSSLIAARLGAGALAQALAAMLAATLPMGILQSTGTQNDCVESFWLVCFVYAGLRLKERDDWRWAVAAGAALGLAWLIKGTGYIFGLPLLAWLLLAGLRSQGWAFFRPVAVVLCAALLLNSTYYMRNLALSGTLVPPSETGHMIGKRFDPNVMAAKLVLNMSFHAIGPWERPNHVIEQDVDRVLRRLKIDQDDERIFFQKEKFSIHSILHEDFAGNPIHALLFVLCVLVLASCRRCRAPEVVPLAAALVCGFVLFAVLLVWSPYHSRNHLPLFVLAAPLTGTVLGALLNRRGIMFLSVFLAAVSLPWLTANKTRPLVGPHSVLKVPRQDQYFLNMPRPADVEGAYTSAVNQVHMLSCRDVGVAMEDGGDYSFEYPLWVLLRQSTPMVRIENVLVHNESARLPYPRGPFQPCALITMEEEGLGLHVKVPQGPYRLLWRSSRIEGFSTAVFAPAQ